MDLLLLLSSFSSTISAQPLISVLFFCFIFYLLLLSYTKNQKSSLPEPPKVPGAWPLLGHVDLRAMPYDKLAAMADTYGPVYSIRLGTQETIVISDWKMAKECFTTHDKLLSNRPPSCSVKYSFNNDYSFFLIPYGPIWRDIRKVTFISLFSNLRLEMQQSLRTSELNVWFNQLHVSSEKAKDAVVSVEMVSWFRDVVFNVIMSIIIGINGDQQLENGLVSNELEKKYQKLLDELMGLMETTSAISDLIPFLEWYDKLTGVTTAISKKAKEMDDIKQIWLQEHRRRLKSRNIITDNTISDDRVLKPYMESMLSSVQNPEFIGLDADAIIKTACQDMVFGSYSSVSIALSWGLFFLMNNRSVMNKAQKELDENIGKNRKAVESDLKQLPYLHAIVKETLRLFHPGSELSRYGSEDCEVGGFHVKAGTKIVLNQWKINRDPNVWPDPLEFKPERFLSGNSNADVDVKGVSYEFSTFGSGRRVCPAAAFVIRLMQLTLARLIHGFEWNIPREDGSADMSAEASIPLIDGRINQLQVLVSPRLASEAYSVSD